MELSCENGVYRFGPQAKNDIACAFQKPVQANCQENDGHMILANGPKKPLFHADAEQSDNRDTDRDRREVVQPEFGAQVIGGIGSEHVLSAVREKKNIHDPEKQRQPQSQQGIDRTDGNRVNYDLDEFI